MGKNVYYQNVVLFTQRIQNLVTFKGVTLVKANIATSLYGPALEWYTSERNNFDWDALDNDSSVKSCINTLSQHFKVPTSVTLGFLTNKTYSLNDVRARRPSAQYIRTIMRYGIGCKIVNVANQHFFAYRGVISELKVFISSPTKSTKAANFIRTFEEKQKIWHKIMTTPVTPQQYYKPVRRSLPFRPPFSSQSKAFSRFQTQQRLPPSQQP